MRGGGCSFGIKVINAQKLGAVAVMIVNTDDKKTMRLMALPDEEPLIKIPCIMVTKLLIIYFLIFENLIINKIIISYIKINFKSAYYYYYYIILIHFFLLKKLHYHMVLLKKIKGEPTSTILSRAKIEILLPDRSAYHFYTANWSFRGI